MHRHLTGTFHEIFLFVFAAMSVMRPELIMKSIIPVVMAGIIAIYGVVVAVLITSQLKVQNLIYLSL